MQLLHEAGHPSPIGLPRQMDDPSQTDDFVPAGLAALGIEADEIELAVMNAAKGMFWPPIVELLSLDTSGLEPERCPDLSQAPERS